MIIDIVLSFDKLSRKIVRACCSSCQFRERAHRGVKMTRGDKGVFYPIWITLLVCRINCLEVSFLDGHNTSIPVSGREERSLDAVVLCEAKL